mgnify:CR=1 FL=1
MITLSDYWMGRDATHPTLMCPMLERNAGITVECVNKLLALAQVAGVVGIAFNYGGQGAIGSTAHRQHGVNQPVNR